MDRERVSSGTEWESTVGYSRAVRDGNEIHVSGTTATDEDGAVVAPGDPYAQTVRAIEDVRAALAALDASLDDVVRTRIFVTDIDDWEAIGRAHGDAFDTVRPATTMVQVERLIDPEMLVEVEAVARD
jgi:enamine deaminase RidA (YjgF/YER057c/UK114 family)